MAQAIDDRIRVVVQEELRPVIERLDKLNGRWNKVLGMGLLIAVFSPVVAALLVKA
jgi:hypothetical protein